MFSKLTLRRIVTILILISMLTFPVSGIVETNGSQLSINAQQATLVKGKTFQLIATTATKVAISWTSEDESVATVNAKGVVTGKGNGTTHITCSIMQEDGKIISESCAVTVITPVQKINIPQSFSVDVGKTAQLELTFAPEDVSDRRVSWYSDNSEIATIDENGVVSGIKAGTCIITVTSNEETKKPITAKCKVSVLQPVTEIKVDKTTLIIPRGKKEKITATVLPEDASNKKVTWSTSDDSIVAVKDGVVTGKTAGDSTVTVFSTNADGSKIECNVPVHVFLPVAKVIIQSKDRQRSLYPGESVTLYAGVEPTDAEYRTVNWKSGDSAIAEIDNNGKITAKKSGQVIIQAISNEPGEKPKTDSIKVNVLVPVRTIGVSCEKVFYTGKQIRIKTEIFPQNASNKKLYYSSSDNSIASVRGDSGVITGESTGCVTITVKAADGQGTIKKFEVWSLDKNNAFPTIQNLNNLNSQLQKLFDEMEKIEKQTDIPAETKASMEQSTALYMTTIAINHMFSEIAVKKTDSTGFSVSNTKPAYCFYNSDQVWVCFCNGDTTRYDIIGYLKIAGKGYTVQLGGYYKDEEALRKQLLKRNGNKELKMISVGAKAMVDAVNKATRTLR